jgi:hypothetical protein
VPFTLSDTFSTHYPLTVEARHAQAGPWTMITVMLLFFFAAAPPIDPVAVAVVVPAPPSGV